MGDQKPVCCDWKNAKGKSEEKETKKAETVALNVMLI